MKIIIVLATILLLILCLTVPVNAQEEPKCIDMEIVRMSDYVESVDLAFSIAIYETAPSY